MTKKAMPQRGSGCSGYGVSHGKIKRVQWAETMAPDCHLLRCKILHRTTSGVKFKRAIVVRSKLANRNKILNKFWGNMNVIKSQVPGKGSSASGDDGK